MKKCLVVLLLIAASAGAETITVATYNIEHFDGHFYGRRLATTRPSWLPRGDEQAIAMLAAIRKGNDEDNWEVSQVILDPKFNPDVLVIQEGCMQEDLDYFNKTWLKNAYETALQFPSNTEFNQHVEILIKPGFKIIQKNDQYYKEVDPTPNERGNHLFARGPSFVLLQSPGGYKFWLGTNHQKSKSGNSVEVTKWRNREAKRTHQIIKELEKAGPNDVIFLGDMNDELGIQQFEMEGGGDVIANLVGPPEDGIFLATRPLAEAAQISYLGYWRPDFRSLIDHVLVTREMKSQIEDVKVFQNNFTSEASDHCPVMVRFHSDPAK